MDRTTHRMADECNSTSCVQAATNLNIPGDGRSGGQRPYGERPGNNCRANCADSPNKTACNVRHFGIVIYLYQK